jgi:signal-transduction protein with cAMP-binding, CBS, and nucleotidyltransferase domain
MMYHRTQPRRSRAKSTHCDCRPMKTSVIRQRVADFLKSHPPFDALSEQDLLDLAGSGRVKFHESEEHVFRKGDAKSQFIWIIQQGQVELLTESGSGEQLRDLLGEGDVLGLERFAGDGSSPYSARTATDVILYGVSAETFEAIVPRYPLVERFVTAHFSVAAHPGFGRTSWLDAEAPPVEYLCSRQGRPCPPCNPPPLSTRAAVREMLQAGVEDLAITQDGTPGSALLAILTASELELFCGHNPVRLVRAIRQASSAAEIAPLLRLARKLVLEALAQPHDVDDCSLIGTEVIGALADACTRLAGNNVLSSGIDPPEAASCWLMFGASARGDLLEPQFPQIAAAYDDSACSAHSEDSLYFAALAGEAAAWFHGCGLTGPDWFWPEGSQPGMPLSEWKRLFRETIRNPVGHDLYSRRELFDIRLLSGDQAVLQMLQDQILLELRGHEMAIPLLANDTLGNLPPLTFFRGLVLDLDGGRRDSFDIMTTAISPIADAARVFAIAQRRLAPVNTLVRLQFAALDYPDDASILRDAAEAFRIALYYRSIAGGSRIDPGMLGKFDQRLLKTAFSSIQRLLEFTASTFIPGT